MKHMLFLLLPFVFSVSYSMEQDENQPTEKWKLIKLFKHYKDIRSFNFNAENKKLLVGDENQTTLYDFNGQRAIFEHPSFWKPFFDPTNQYIVTGPRHKKIRLLDTNGKEITTIKTESYNWKVKCNTQGNRILATSSEKIKLLGVEDGKSVAEYRTNFGCAYLSRITVAKFFPQNEKLIFIAHRGDSAMVWDTRCRKPIKSACFRSLKKASIHPKGNYLACIVDGAKDLAYIYDLRKAKDAFLNFHFNHDIEQVKFNNTHILTRCTLSPVRLWEIQALPNYLKRETFVPDDEDREVGPEPTITLEKRNIRSAKFHSREKNRILTYSKTTRFSPENSISIWDTNGNEIVSYHMKNTFLRQNLVQLASILFQEM